MMDGDHCRRRHIMTTLYGVRQLRSDRRASTVSLGGMHALCVSTLPAPFPSHFHTGGILVLTSSLCWDEKHTDRSNWLGGIHRDGTTHESETVLKALLAADYTILKVSGIAALSRRTPHKCGSVSQP